VPRKDRGFLRKVFLFLDENPGRGVKVQVYHRNSCRIAGIARQHDAAEVSEIFLTAGEALGLELALKGTVLTFNVGVHKITVLPHSRSFWLAPCTCSQCFY
jgi:hypothetical protein